MGEVSLLEKKSFRTGYIKNLAPVIQPILKVCGVKYYITDAKRWCLNRPLELVRNFFRTGYYTKMVLKIKAIEAFFVF
jgi:hypothetical protein